MTTHPLKASWRYPAGGDFYALRSWGQHAAQDYAVGPVPCYAMRTGIVKAAAWAGNAGNLVVIDHHDGSRSRYAHLSKVEVFVGQSVAEGQRIGVTGNTGDTGGGPPYGYHLHFAVWMPTLTSALRVQRDPYKTQGWYAVDPEIVLKAEEPAPETEPPAQQEEDMEVLIHSERDKLWYLFTTGKDQVTGIPGQENEGWLKALMAKGVKQVAMSDDLIDDIPFLDPERFK